MARLELEVGTDVLLLETGDALLLEVTGVIFQAVGGGSIAMSGALNAIKLGETVIIHLWKVIWE